MPDTTHSGRVVSSRRRRCALTLLSVLRFHVLTADGFISCLIIADDCDCIVNASDCVVDCLLTLIHLTVLLIVYCFSRLARYVVNSMV